MSAERGVMSERVLNSSLRTPHSSLYYSLIKVDDAGAGREADAEADDDRRAGAVVLPGEHEARRGARQVAVVLQDLVGGAHLRRAYGDGELRADAVEDFLAAGVNQTTAHVLYLRDGRVGECVHATHARDSVVRAAAVHAGAA